MAECGLLNLGTCLPQKFFEFISSIINAPIRPFLDLALRLLSNPIDISIFVSFWAIIVYMLSMFYALLLVGTGFNFMISGYDSAKRENAKNWLRNIDIMIILVQASYFMYQLAVDLSAAMTSATLTQVNNNFFYLSVDNLNDLALKIVLGLVYLATLILTTIILVIRYVFVAIGVVLFPIAIFFYFLQPLKSYGVLILNFLGIAVFVTFFDAILLAGFSRLNGLSIFANMQIITLISSFLLIDVLMLLLMTFSVVKAGFSAYSDVKKIGGAFI